MGIFNEIQYLCSAIIKKDGGIWSCDVLATHPPEVDKGATSSFGNYRRRQIITELF